MFYVNVAVTSCTSFRNRCAKLIIVIRMIMKTYIFVKRKKRLLTQNFSNKMNKLGIKSWAINIKKKEDNNI